MNYNKVFIYLTAFVSGFVLMGYEIFGSRVLMPCFGSSTYVWGALISIFMSGLSIGYLVGGRVAEQKLGYRTLGLLLLIPGLIILTFPIYGQCFCEIANNFDVDNRMKTIIAALLLFFTSTIFIGMISPYLVTMNIRSMDRVGSGSGTIFSITTFGSIAGTITSSFFLVGLIPTSNAIPLFGVILIINAIVSFILYKK